MFSFLSSDASVSLPIEGKKYMRHLVAQAMLQFFVCVQARENAQMFIRLHSFVLSLPKLLVSCSQNNVPLGQSTRIRLEFKNPLTNSLSRIIFHVCGSGLCKQKELSYKYEPHHLQSYINICNLFVLQEAAVTGTNSNNGVSNSSIPAWGEPLVSLHPV